MKEIILKHTRYASEQQSVDTALAEYLVDIRPVAVQLPRQPRRRATLLEEHTPYLAPDMRRRAGFRF